MKKCTTEEKFLDACRAAAIIGTVQASYDWFDYLGQVSHKIVSGEALLGVSMTGMMDTPDIAFDEKLQRKAAKLILKVNSAIAKKLGINECARATCVKPAGSTSCILGTASGIHPHHSKRYFRRVQANVHEFPVQHMQVINPTAVELSVWSKTKTDAVITFLCEVPDGSKTKNQVGAIDLLEHVKLTQQNWVQSGTRHDKCVQPWLRHNVSNTITVKPEEWEDVTNYIYRNRAWFAGISLLPFSGDKDYPQAPFCAVYTPQEIVKEYGEGSLLASGLIVDGMHVFLDNLWEACDFVLGVIPQDDCTEEQKDWIRRVGQFAERYLDNDLRRTTYLLKDVHNFKIWVDLNREYKHVDWDDVTEENHKGIDVSTLGAQACSGGKCDVDPDISAAIEEQENNRKKKSK